MCYYLMSLKRKLSVSFNDNQICMRILSERVCVKKEQGIASIFLSEIGSEWRYYVCFRNSHISRPDSQEQR